MPTPQFPTDGNLIQIPVGPQQNLPRADDCAPYGAGRYSYRVPIGLRTVRFHPAAQEDEEQLFDAVGAVRLLGATYADARISHEAPTRGVGVKSSYYVVNEAIGRAAWWLGTLTKNGTDPPPHVAFQVRAAVACIPETLVDKTIVANVWGDHGLITQVSGLLHDQIEFWARLTEVGPPLQVTLQCILDLHTGSGAETGLGQVVNGVRVINGHLVP